MEYDARVERVGAEIVSTTGGVEVYAVIEATDGQTNLRPGAFVAVSLSDKTYQDVALVPESAIYGEDLLFVIKDGRMVERRVHIQGYDGSNVLIDSPGESPIEDGDLIIITQLREGGSGAKVEVR
jgi:multidrug efflux pump subunit AcrA (membrane-fusion protein)